MIIRFPTGFFTAVVPRNTEARGNVTYTISDSTPPRTNLVFPKAARGIIDRKRKKISNDFTRRSTQGSLIFSVSRSSQSNTGNNSRTFELGQILEFDSVEPRSLQPMLVGQSSEIRHDTNLFDYSLLDLTDEDVQIINKTSFEAQKKTVDQLNQIRLRRKDLELEIVNQQKIINDTTRNIDSIDIMISSGEYPELAQILTKLKNRRDEAFIARDQARDQANELAISAEQLNSYLRAISTTVK